MFIICQNVQNCQIVKMSKCSKFQINSKALISKNDKNTKKI